MNNLFPAIGIVILIITHPIIAGEYIYYPDIDVWYNFHNNPLNWQDAYIHCKSENATLAMPKNQKEADVMVELLNSNNEEYALIGFHDLFVDGEYLYLDDSPIYLGFNKWGENKPKGNIEENCGAIYETGTIDDHVCENKRAAFICERRERKHVVNQIYTYDEAYRYFDKVKKSYKLHMDIRVWGLARTICKAEGGNLAIIRSEEEEEIIMDLFKDPKYLSSERIAFIGFHDLFKEGHYTTVKDEDIHKIGYLNWSEEDVVLSPETNCGAIDKQISGVFDHDCNDPRMYFCERSYS